jgi:hypothetical protein
MLQALCVPSLARALGWAGIIPFVALSLSAVFTIGSISQIWAMDALALYGAVILSFLGGAVWGLTLGHEGEALRPGAQGLLIGIAASLAGFGGALTPLVFGAPLMIAGFVAMLIYDLGAISRGLLPQWYRPLRIALSVAATGSLAFAAVFGA